MEGNDMLDIDKIQETINDEMGFAESIMEGGDNYDGDDGARSVIELCNIANSLIKELIELRAQVAKNPEDTHNKYGGEA
jgi:hypothetical protein